MLLKSLPPIPKILVAMSLLLLLAALPMRARAFDVEMKKPPDAAAALLDVMMGQMIMVGFTGYKESDSGVIAVHDQLADGVIGGVVLYPENIGRPDELRKLTSFLHDARPAPV